MKLFKAHSVNIVGTEGKNVAESAQLRYLNGVYIQAGFSSYSFCLNAECAVSIFSFILIAIPCHAQTEPISTRK